MPRPYSTTAITGQQLIERTHRIFDNTPLHGLTVVLEEIFASAFSVHSTSLEQSLRVCGRLVDYYERLFANGFGDRFDIDAWLMTDICNAWSRGTLRLGDRIVPVYGENWAYSLLPSPWERSQKPIDVYVVTFRGRSQLSDVKWLDYPWLFHELGHHLLARAGMEFVGKFRTEVETYTKNLLRKSVPDSPEVKNRSRNLVERIRGFWTPTPKQCDWAHELAVDVIALWTCGPAFLASMMDILEAEVNDPLQVTAGHPPYELRVRVLVELGKELEWNEECKLLDRTVRSWRERELADRLDNDYAAMAENALVETCCDLAIKACRNWDLPQCNQQSVNEVRRKFRGYSFDSATEIIVAAWLKQSLEPDNYLNWEQATIMQLAQELKP